MGLFFRKFSLFSKKNGQVIVFFGLIIISILLISTGIALRSIEIRKFEYNNIFKERLDLVKNKFQTKNEELLLNYKEAQNKFDNFKSEYSNSNNDLLILKCAILSLRFILCSDINKSTSSNISSLTSLFFCLMIVRRISRPIRVPMTMAVRPRIGSNRNQMYLRERIQRL